MDSILTVIGEFLNGLGPLVALPIVISLLGIVLGQKWTSAIRSGVLTAVAFVGIFLTVGLLGSTVSTIGANFATNTGTNLDVIDIGWPAASALAFGTPVGNLIIPLGILLNVILLVVGLTQTLDVDIWNFWHMAFVGALVQFVTGNFAFAMFAALVSLVIALFLADWSAPLIQRYFKMPGISIPHLQSASLMLLALPFAWLINKVPFLRNLKLNPEVIRKKIGLLGEPMILGLIIGFLLGIFGGQKLYDAILTAINTAAVMVLIPRMVSILVEALSPVADAASEFMAKRSKGKKFFIGLDSAVLAGNPTVIATGLLLVPVELLLAFALSPLGNHTLPFIDLADGVFVAAMLAPLVAGDVLLTTLLGAIVMGIGLIFTTLLSPAITELVNKAPQGLDIPSGFAKYTVMSDAALPTSYGFFYLFKSPIAVAVIVSLLIVVALYFLKKTVKLENIFPDNSEVER